MKCPMCNSEDTKIITSRSKMYNHITKDFKNLPDVMNDLSDYRMRRHRCKNCGYCFDTVEIYYNFKNTEQKDEKSIVYFQ